MFAVERFLRFLVLGAAAYGVWRFRYDRAGIQQAFNNDLPAIRDLYRDMGFNVNNSHLLGLIRESFTLDSGRSPGWPSRWPRTRLSSWWRCIGLWQGKRWGEYFAMVATSVFIPYEIYDLTVKITWLRLLAFGVNRCWSSTWCGPSGCSASAAAKAYDAALRSESVIEVEQAALAAGAAEPPGQGERAGVPVQPPGGSSD